MKILMIETCQVNFGGTRGAEHVEQHSTQEVDEATARLLCVTCNRALYLDKKDDPTKGQRTAEQSQIRRAAAELEAKRKAEAEAAAELVAKRKAEAEAAAGKDK